MRFWFRAASSSPFARCHNGGVNIARARTSLMRCYGAVCSMDMMVGCWWRCLTTMLLLLLPCLLAGLDGWPVCTVHSTNVMLCGVACLPCAYAFALLQYNAVWYVLCCAARLLCVLLMCARALSNAAVLLEGRRSCVVSCMQQCP